MEVDEDLRPEEEYNEEEDDDFNPDLVAADNEVSDSDESSPEIKATAGKRSKPSTESHKTYGQGDTSRNGTDDFDFSNSGDEGIIKEGSKAERKQKRKRKNEERDEDSGGEGGFVKTRSMRAAAEQVTLGKSTALTGKVTADIDAIWARLTSASIEPTSLVIPDKVAAVDEAEDAEMITIKRTYTFAGKLHTETKVVPRSSAQAKAYLATKDSRVGAESESTEAVPAVEVQGKTGPEGQVLLQPQRRVSVWDPNPSGFVKGLPTAPTIARVVVAGNALKTIDKDHLGGDAKLWHRATPELVMRAGRAVLQSIQGPAPASNLRQLKAQKLNVVDKSKLDWAEHVDTVEGARDELEQAKKDKTNFLERRDFLDRVEDKAESERAKARGVVR